VSNKPPQQPDCAGLPVLHRARESGYRRVYLYTLRSLVKQPDESASSRLFLAALSASVNTSRRTQEGSSFPECVE
jgi:hypothetical protein